MTSIPTFVSDGPREVQGLANADYHAHPAVGSSHLKAIARSPAHYWAEFLDPARPAREEKPAFVIGTAIHAAILEPERFKTEYVVGPRFDRRTKAGKEAAAAFEAENAGKRVLSLDDYEACVAIRRSVEQHDVASVIFEHQGDAETSLFWNDRTGDEPVMCKARPDRLTKDSRILVDVKSTEDARPAAFSRDAYNYRDHVSAAHYVDGVLAVRGVTPELFIFLVVEKSPPYAVAAYFADAAMLDAGRAEVRRNLATLRACRRSQEWPAYPQQILPISLPPWAAKREAYEVI